MRIVSTLKDLAQILSQLPKNKSLGFVPTMGALHQGHLDLVKKAVQENDFSICSIFVNPTQFNNAEDLDKYPNPLEKDLSLLENASCDIVFTPTKTEIYPEGLVSKSFNFGQLDKVMEGANRPGHFEGVAMVVSRFFELINPQRAYFGEKDFQQLAIIQSMAKQGSYPVEIVPCATVREQSGLAMSSRNMRLTESQKQASVRIYKRLNHITELCNSQSISEVKSWVETSFIEDKDLDLEYFEISCPTTLTPSQNWNERKTHIACIAVFVGEVRLIDNILLKIN